MCYYIPTCTVAFTCYTVEQCGVGGHLTRHGVVGYRTAYYGPVHDEYWQQTHRFDPCACWRWPTCTHCDHRRMDLAAIERIGALSIARLRFAGRRSYRVERGRFSRARDADDIPRRDVGIFDVSGDCAHTFFSTDHL